MNEHVYADQMKRKIHRIHFVGIGGIGMSGIAEVLINLGYRVSGSDLSAGDITQRLASLGADIFSGHAAAHLGESDVVVTSTAIRRDNPEVMAAKERGIPVIPRAEMLAELLKMKVSIAISGSHGKTTTTSMIATVLASGGFDPTMVIGGKLASIGSNARLGRGEIIVAEADESDGSFLMLSPSLAVITNIDREHLDHYRDLEEIQDAFVRFANAVPFYGVSFVCADDIPTRAILPRVKRKVTTYGFQKGVDFRAVNVHFDGPVTRFTVFCHDQPLGDVTLNVPGEFNVQNALATVAVCREMNMDFATIGQGLSSFRGAQRRLEVKGRSDGTLVVDDYGHHPTEIRATLAAAKQVWKDPLVVVFQPHRYSRTQALYDDFLIAFGDADTLIVTDIYAASEEPIAGIHSRALVEGIRDHGHPDVLYLASFPDIVQHLQETIQSPTVLLTLGAGNIWKVGIDFLKQRDGGKGNIIC